MDHSLYHLTVSQEAKNLVTKKGAKCKTGNKTATAPNHPSHLCDQTRGSKYMVPGIKGENHEKEAKGYSK